MQESKCVVCFDLSLAAARNALSESEVCADRGPARNRRDGLARSMPLRLSGFAKPTAGAEVGRQSHDGRVRRSSASSDVCLVCLPYTAPWTLSLKSDGVHFFCARRSSSNKVPGAGLSPSVGWHAHGCSRGHVFERRVGRLSGLLRDARNNSRTPCRYALVEWDHSAGGMGKRSRGTRRSLPVWHAEKHTGKQVCPWHPGEKANLSQQQRSYTRTRAPVCLGRTTGVCSPFRRMGRESNHPG